MGTLVHAANEAFCEGEDFDIAKAVSDLISDEPGASIWKTMNFDDVVNQALGYVLGLEAWWTDFHPVVDTYESVVRYPGKYIGSLDLRCVVNELDTIVDIKTTSVQDEDKGLYTDSWSLQLAGYGYAPEEVLYEDHVCQAPDPSTWTPKGWWECSTCGKRQKEEGDKRPRVREVGTRPWSPPEAYGVIHLRGQEDYGFYKMPVDESVHKHFLALADLYAWQSKLATPSLIAAA